MQLTAGGSFSVFRAMGCCYLVFCVFLTSDLGIRYCLSDSRPFDDVHLWRGQGRLWARPNGAGMTKLRRAGWYLSIKPRLQTLAFGSSICRG